EIVAELSDGLLDLRGRAHLVVLVVDAPGAANGIDDGQEGGRRAVRRAPALDPAMWRLAEPLAELGQEARLAEACFADEEDHLAVSRGGALEALAQQIELALPSDERALAGHVDRSLDARCPPPDDGVCVQCVGFADAQVARSQLAPGLDA